MRDIASLIKKLKELQVRIAIRDEHLAIEPLQDPLPPDVLEEIRAQKEALMAYCLENQQLPLYSGLQPAPAMENYPLSSAQRRLWIISQFEESNRAYHITGAYAFHGAFDPGALQSAFRQVVGRHEILRTVFRENEQQELRQYILPADATDHSIGCVDVSREADPVQAAQLLIQEEAVRPFALASGPLVRATLYQLADSQWIFSYVMHHIISDGWSMGILIKEVLHYYQAYCENKPAALRPLSIQYKDYAVWQQEQLRNDQLQKHKLYWLQQFEEGAPALQLPADRPRPSVRTHNGSAIQFTIGAAAADGLRQVAAAQGATVFMSLLAAVKVLLYRYTGQQDIVIGTSIASREHSLIEDQIGFYVNTLAFRSQLDGEQPFLQVLEKVRKTTLGAYAHQAYPFDALVEDLALQRDRSRHPLFDVMVVMKNMVAVPPSIVGESGAKSGHDGQGLAVTDYETPERIFSKFDLSFFFAEDLGGISLKLVYNKDLFNDHTILQMARHLEQLIATAVQHPETPISRLNYLLPAEQTRLLQAGAGTGKDNSSVQSIVDLFDRQAAATPDVVAVVAGEQAITYRELQQQANNLAGWLITSAPINTGDRVGILLDRSAWSVISLLGVLKAGAGYVFIDPDQPTARKQFIVQDAGAQALITQTEYIFELEFYKGPVFAIDIQLEGALAATLPSSCAPQPASLAYVTYTSGSTGQPKGVMISHAAVVDYYHGLRQRVPIHVCRNFGLVSTLAADLGNTVLFGALLSGGTLHVFPDAAILDPHILHAAQLDCLKITPSHWKALVAAGFAPLPARCLVFGGEALSSDILHDIRQRHSSCEIFNHYGPTETTIGKLLHRVNLSDPAQVAPLGKPFGNNDVYILDDHHLLCPFGVAGEICISGEGLALGYLNQPSLTSEKFIPHPFYKDRLMYRTGDRGKWLTDGTVAFLGRKDQQLKIRGYRVEPGEIETALRTIASVSDAIVCLKHKPSREAVLVAYIVSAQPVNRTELQQHLQRTLPAYMWPAHYVQVEKIPLTANGKIAYHLLPEIEGQELGTGTPYVAPRTVVEEELAAIWQEVLGRPRIGVFDNFFDLGGHSIKAVQLITRINARFQVRINLQSLFEEGTIESIAEQIQFVGNQQNITRDELKEIEL